jgi:hypothetical protein
MPDAVAGKPPRVVSRERADPAAHVPRGTQPSATHLQSVGLPAGRRGETDGERASSRCSGRLQLLTRSAPLLASLWQVIKIGTSSLIRAEAGCLNLAALAGTAEVVRSLRDAGVDVVLVSSGSVGAGCQRLGLAERPAEHAKRQALAAVGQGLVSEQLVI